MSGYIYSSSAAFAALKSDGTVIAWGAGGGVDDDGDEVNDAGGNCSHVQAQLVDVQRIYSTMGVFAAFKADGEIVFWGDSEEFSVPKGS